MVATGKKDFNNRLTQLLISKAIGVLSICEQNRKQASQLGFVHYLITILCNYKKDGQVVGNALWALVTVLRPVGGIEGEEYSSTDEENFSNVIQFSLMHGVELLFIVINEHYNDPLLLSKAFWLSVNLSLMDNIKMKLIQQMSIISVIEFAMRRFPEHEELQYRTCFALINLAMSPEAKRQIQELGIIPLVVRAAQKFPNSQLLQKTFCNVVRSLISTVLTSSLILDMRVAGVAEVLQVIEEKFAGNVQLVTLAETVRSYIDLRLIG